MYFDGISGAYNRQCAQWWLTRAAAQDDPEVYPMAQQALQSIVPEMALLPKVYRPVTAVECDRLPAWHVVADEPVLSLAAVEAVSVIPELPEGDAGTEERGVGQEAPVSSAVDDETDMGEKATVSVGAEVQIDMAQGSIAETETTAENPPEQVAGVTPERGDFCTRGSAGNRGAS